MFLKHIENIRKFAQGYIERYEQKENDQETHAHFLEEMVKLRRQEEEFMNVDDRHMRKLTTDIIIAGISIHDR